MSKVKHGSTYEIAKLNISYFYNKIYKKLINHKMGQEINVIDSKKKIKILLITCDNRPDEEFVKIHNLSLNKYARLNTNIDYMFYSDCGRENIYWSRLFLIRNLLLQNKYDYIGWLDSDTMIINYDFNLENYLNMNSNIDIFVADDNMYTHVGINSGIFIIKNSQTGLNFILDVINQYKNNIKCKTNQNQLKGIFAGVCYEQAQMELAIHNKYKNNTIIIPTNIVLCSKVDLTDNYIFIYHRYDTGSEKKNEVFKKIYDK